jgi:hypothetical protein
MRSSVLSHDVFNTPPQSRPQTAASTILTPAPPSTVKSSLRHISNWWPVRTGHALPPIVDVPLAQGKEVRPAAFHCLRGSQASICSATLRQVLLNVTAATDVMKILIHPHLHRTLILNEHLHQCRLTLGSMEAAICVSDL